MAVSADLVDRVLRTAVAVALDHHAAYDRLDGVAGDGDFGSTLVRGAGALAAAPPSGSAADRLREAGRLASDTMGGSSGAFTGVALVRAASAVDEGAAAALAAAVAGIHEYGGAEPGDKTLLDALAPLADALGDDPGDVAAAVAAARAGADATAGMQARRGRASYAGGDVQEAADPGATAVADIAEAVASGQEPPSWADLHARAERLDTGDDEDAGPRRGLIGHPTALVGIALDGLAGAHPRLLRRLEDAQVVVGHAIADGPRRVAVVSGGGAGHEPLHAGFVGEGMLDAAVPGAVFTSPAPGQILAAARAVHRGAGVLFVVKRYTGDVLNFRLARELAAAEDIVVETVIVADDVAIPADAPTGRRGTGTTIAVEKVAGAAAARGDALDAVAALAQRAADAGRSYGIAIHGEEIEIGVGIHGEPGRGREPLPSPARFAELLLEPVLAEVDTSAPVLVLLSGLGGTPQLQLSALYEHVAAGLRDRDVTVARSLVGDLITSLDQPGALLTVVALDDELLALWDAPARTAALVR
jgi:dihydroxyacetone kinase